MLEIDTILFGGQDWLPVLIPEHVAIMQKAQKKSSPKKKKEKTTGSDDEKEKTDEQAFSSGAGDDSTLAKLTSKEAVTPKRNKKNIFDDSQSTVLIDHIAKKKLE